MLTTGARIDPSLRLSVVHGGAKRDVTLADLLTRPTVVSIYMKNNTPSCDRQNESLAAQAAEIDALGFNLVALSRDTCGSHLKYSAKKGIAYTLASDPEDGFARAADAIVEKSMYGKTYHGPARAAFVLAKDGRVLAVIEKVDTKDHAAQVLSVLRGLR